MFTSRCLAKIWGVHIKVRSPMERIHEIRLWKGPWFYNINTKCHNHWLRHSKVNKRDTQTGWRSYKSTLFIILNKEIRLRIEIILAYFPYFEKCREAYEITLLSVCVSVCVWVSPQILRLMRSPFCFSPSSSIFDAVHVLSKESEWLILPRNYYVNCEVTLLSVCVFPNLFIFYAIHIISKESRRSALPRTSY
jgi:hypothetical protein